MAILAIALILSACNLWTDSKSDLSADKKLELQTPDLSQTTVSLDAAPAVADGVAKASAHVTFRNKNGDIIAGVKPELAATADGSSITCTESDSLGVSDCEMLSTVSGTLPLSLKAPFEMPLGNLIFIAGAVDAAHSSLASDISSTISDGSHPIVMTLTLRDAFGNLATGRSVAVSSSRGATDTLSVSTVSTDNAGKAIFTVKSSTAGTPTVQAVEASALSPFSLGLSFVAPVVSVANSSISGSGPVTADGIAASTVTITLHDASNIGISGIVPTFAATDGGSTNAYETCSATNGSGQSTCTLKATRAESKSLSLVTPISKAGNTVVFSAGAAASITITGGNTQSAAAGTTLPTDFSVVVKDANLNVVPGITIDWTPTAGSVNTPTDVTTSASGVAVRTYTLSTTAGSASIVAKVHGSSPAISATFSATSNPGSASLSHSTVAVNATSLESPATATATVTARDVYDNLISSGLTVTFGYSGGTSTVTYGSVSNIGSGQYQATLTAYRPGSATSIVGKIGGSDLTSTLPTLTVTAPTLTFASSFPNNVTGWTNGSSAAVTLSLNSVGPSGTTYECRTGPVSSVGSASWVNCDASTGTTTSVHMSATSGSEEGSYETQARYKIGTYASTAITYDFYAHHTLDGVASCTDKATDAAYFAKAAQYLDTSHVFKTGTVVQAPFLHFVYNNNDTADVLTLRHGTVMNSSSTMVLFKRIYKSYVTNTCNTAFSRVTIGIDGFGYNRNDYACDALVLSADSHMVCLSASGGVVSYQYLMTHSGRKLVADETGNIFRAKTRIAAHAGTGHNLIYLPP